MRKRMLKMIKNEGGQALLLVIALLGVGSIMLAPMLAFMGTGLKAGQVYEVKVDEFYAADAGVEDAMWNIKNGGQDLEGVTAPGIPYLETGLPPYLYIPPPPGEPLSVYSGTYAIADVNGNSVSITIEWHSGTDGIAYKAISTATGADGSDTVIEAWVTTVYGDYGGLLDNAITSPTGVTLQPGSEVDGGILCPNEPSGGGDYDEWIDEEVTMWPDAGQLITYYMMDVAGLTPEPLGTIDIKDDVPEPAPPDDNERYLWPIYREGDLEIESSQEDLTLFLGDPSWVEGDPLNTIYVTGNFDIMTAKGFRLDLNGQTIFVEGSVYIDPKVELWGSGCIVAIGDIDVAPDLPTDPDGFILLCSVEGYIKINPKAAFYGSCVGDTEVQVQPGGSIIHNPPPDYLNFPDGDDDDKMFWGILSWKIS